MSAAPTSTSKPAVLAVMKLPPFYIEKLQQSFELLDRLHQTDPQAFAQAAPRIRAVTGGGESLVDRALLAQLPALEMVSIMGVGYDKVDVAAALERRIPVTHTPDVLNDEVADTAIGLMLSVAKKLPQADRYVRDGRWETQGAMPLSRKMSGARLGIVGLGRIGQAIAKRAEAFGMSIAYTSRNRKDVKHAYFPSAAELAAQVDFLVVITPGGAATRHMINAEVLRALGPQGYLVNVARGSVVDEAALIDALQKGVIAGAALDVFENEPRVPQALRELDNVVLAPHIGSATVQTRHAMAALAFDNLAAHFAGQPLLTPVPECR
ncbi:2-hydroxyacid dehydrogenase [Ramlibacter sp. Leaf400]|uniref:2-hydroxyacid dehydrogenase n=1 Tax=Ramlibacter sp. Leaf400 TaxID=1736365 RepID=UPI0006F995D4|nr:2-hydroxyacid dehydrogenase [Ramlibacter sp. Leaf400]KQT08048.1 hydroxyacid dehydrogenase [Ramlibacter sp. Leaf400]